MKRYFILIFVTVFAVINISAKDVYTSQCNDKNLIKTANTWMKSDAWRNGFIAAKPHKTVNAVDFYTQYHKNKIEWDAAFKWLATHDLVNMPKGDYPIEGTNMKASIQDDVNGALSKRQSESHYHHIDLQYTVSGIEGFGLIEHNSSSANCKYRPDVIHYNYQLEKAHFYNSAKNKFFLFFPEDWHIAKVLTNKKNQAFRVVVIKIDYID